MDLLATIRKEGSRGGVNFSWSDVATSSRRENYLGHSLMAPVGRWAKNKDLTWYAKANDGDAVPGEETAEEKRERERKEEIRRIKEAEEDALNAALGRPVKDRSNANEVPLGEVDRMMREGDGTEVEGMGKFAKLEKELDDKAKAEEGGRERRHRHRDRSRDRERRHRHRDDRERHYRSRRDRSRSGSRERRRHRRRDERSRSRDGHRRRNDDDRRYRQRDDDKPREKRDDHENRRHRSRSRSPRRRTAEDAGVDNARRRQRSPSIDKEQD
jgi:hypothetical protein